MNKLFKNILQILIKLAKVANSMRELKPKNPNMTNIYRRLYDSIL